MGRALTFTCRCGHVVIGGTKEATGKDKQSTVLSVREQEPLSSLAEKFCRAHSLPHESAKVIMTFDGRTLDANKTPAFYEMEDEDLIDVSASAQHRLTAAEQKQAARVIAPSTLSSFARTPTKPPVGSLGKSMRFSCRTKITVASAPAPKKRGRPPKQKPPPPSSKTDMVTKTVGLRQNECLGVLAKRLCSVLGNLPLTTTGVVMRFDGCVLDSDKTPKFYDMEDEDMIEVSIEKQEEHTSLRPPLGNGSGPVRSAAAGKLATRSSSRKNTTNKKTIEV
jgi:hypothetical protein